MVGYHYTYLVISIFYLVLFTAVILIFNKRPGFPMFFMGILLCGAGPICEFFSIPDYWNPDFILGAAIQSPLGMWKFGIEDLIGSIGNIGLTVFIFELINKPFDGLPKQSLIPIIRILGLTTLALVMICIFFFVFHIRGIHACNFSNAILAIVIMFIRPTYWKASLITAIICSFLYWLVLQLVVLISKPDIFNVVWNPNGRFGFLVGGVPIEELIWSFLLTLVVGPLYRIGYSLPNYYEKETWLLNKISPLKFQK